MTLSDEEATYLKTLGSADGYIDPENIVVIAQDPDNLLHTKFEWNDEIAGHKHRIEQARQLIRYVKLEVRVSRQTIATPFYVVDPKRPAKSRRYIEATIAARNQSMRHAILQDEISRILHQMRRGWQVALSLGLLSEYTTGLEEAMQQTFEEQRPSEGKHPGARKPTRKVVARTEARRTQGRPG